MCKRDKSFVPCGIVPATACMAVLGVLVGALGLASWAVPPTISRAIQEPVHEAFDHSDIDAGSHASWVSTLDKTSPFVHFDM